MACSDTLRHSITPPSNRIGDTSEGGAFDGLEEDLIDTEKSWSALRTVSTLLNNFALNLPLTY